MCREWNSFFEPANFEKLILHQDDVEAFRDFVLGRHRALLVGWVWVRIELPLCDCTRCCQPESVEEDKANKFIFTNAIWRLFEILSGFNKTHPGITLELSAHSPSMVVHYAQDARNMLNDTAWHSNRALGPRRMIDSPHNWINGQRRPMKDGAALRMVGPPRGLRFELRAPTAKRMRSLLKVKVVKALVIRLQCYRHFSVPKALDHIIRNLTQLRDLTYECWKSFTSEKIAGRHIRGKEHLTLFEGTFKYRRTLRKVSIFEGTSRCNYRHAAPEWTFARPTVSLGAALAETSRHFEELHMNDMVDARDFFSPFWLDDSYYKRKRFE